MLRRTSIIAILITAAILSGCSTKTRPELVNPAVVAASGILAEGSLSLTRAVPVDVGADAVGENLSDSSILDVPMIGLVPGSIPALLAPRVEPIGAWLSINQSNKTISIVESGTVMFSSPFIGDAPSSNSLSVLLKQRNAVWFAPDQYFTARGLEVPAGNSRDRYLKGALGDFVVYLAEDFAIYSGPTDVPEISGIRVEPNDLARLYYLLPVGTKALSQ